MNSPSTTIVPLVSDKIAITIDPRTPEQEQQVLADARAKLATESDRAEGALLLNALQTPSAREAMRPLLSDKDASGAANAAAMGLMEAPNPRVEAKALLDDVTAGRLTVCINLEWVYSWTERYDLPWGTSEEFSQEHTAAFKRIMDAGIKATGGSGPAYSQLLWTQYQSNRLDPKAASYRAALAAHQLELSQKNKDDVITGWYSELADRHRVRPLSYFPTPDWVPKLGGDDFLPLVREAVAALLVSLDPATANGPSSPPLPRQEAATQSDEQRFKTYAMVILANVKPDEARPLIRDAILHGSPIFFSGSFPVWGDSDLVPVMPTDPMPELDAVLRSKLADSNLFNVMPLVDRYGSTNLVADVLRVYTPEEGRNNSTVRDAMLRYLLRSDPAKGVEALEQNLQLRDGGYKTLLYGMLFDRWTPLALPLLEKSLDDSDNDVVVSAISALERNSCADSQEKAISALERIIFSVKKTNSPEKPDATISYRDVAGGLLHSKRWKYTADQLASLKTLATYPGSSWIQ